MSVRTYGNIILIPFHGKDATFLGVEIRAIWSSAPFCYPTTSIAVYKRIAIGMIFATTRLESTQQLESTWNCGGGLTEMEPVKPAVVFSEHPKIVEQLARVMCDSNLPGAVCHATWLCWLSWTPSIMSISPPFKGPSAGLTNLHTKPRTYGQFPPTVQNAGHTPVHYVLRVNILANAKRIYRLTTSPRCLV